MADRQNGVADIRSIRGSRAVVHTAAGTHVCRPTYRNSGRRHPRDQDPANSRDPPAPSATACPSIGTAATSNPRKAEQTRDNKYVITQM